MIGVILLGLLGLYLFYFYWKVRSLPPGPFPIPLLGNFPQLGLSCILFKRSLRGTLRKWQEEYGDVYTIWIGPMATVNICDYQKSQEAMIKKGSNFADRPIIFLMEVLREGRGVIASNGQHWLEQRRFALHTLRNFGLGRNIMEDRIMLEVDYRSGILTKEIEKNSGQITINPANLFDITVGNIINRLLFTERFTEENEEKFYRMKHLLDYMMENASIMDFFLDEWNIKLPLFKSRYTEIYGLALKLIEFVGEPVKLRQAEIAAGKRDLKGEPEDYVDAFLMQIQKDDNGNQVFNVEALIITLVDLWFAGQETTSTTLYWAFSYLTLRPKVVEKAQAELDSVTARNRSLSLSDKPNTPYLNAVITEILRLSHIVSLNLWRNTAEDTQVGDYLIKKGTAISAQLCLIMSDPKKFDNPLEFNPDRFINTNLEQFSTPFGMGKRACLGESLARAELYLIIGNFLNSFNIKADPDNMASFDALKELANVRRARPYKITFSKRC